jgi:nitrous oxide reductase accessory protein NosL
MIGRQIFTSIGFAVLLGGCWGEPETGPVEIRYGREVGEYCQMIISDPRYAAEIRRAKGEKVFKFDDIGDAIHWLKLKKWELTPELEIWVRDMNTGKKWLAARKVFYRPDQHSPMEYGFGAVEEKVAGVVDFDEMRKRVIAHGSTTRCEPSDHPNAAGAENSQDKG